jgi:hypothetical protein
VPVRPQKLSLFSCACALGAMPVLLLVDPASAGAAGVGAKAGIAATLGGFGLFTTGLLHWFTGSYVHRLSLERASGAATAETLSFLAQPRTARFSLADVRPADTLHPLSSFQVGGGGAAEAAGPGQPRAGLPTCRCPLRAAS